MKSVLYDYIVKAKLALVSTALKQAERVLISEETLLSKESERISLVLAILNCCIVEIKGFIL